MNSFILRIQKRVKEAQEACEAEEKARQEIPPSGFAAALRDLSGAENICMECKPIYESLLRIIKISPHPIVLSNLEISKGFKNYHFILESRFLHRKYLAQFPRLRSSEITSKVLKEVDKHLQTMTHHDYWGKQIVRRLSSEFHMVLRSGHWYTRWSQRFLDNKRLVDSWDFWGFQADFYCDKCRPLPVIKNLTHLRSALISMHTYAWLQSEKHYRFPFFNEGKPMYGFNLNQLNWQLNNWKDLDEQLAEAQRRFAHKLHQELIEGQRQLDQAIACETERIKRAARDYIKYIMPQLEDEELQSIMNIYFKKYEIDPFYSLPSMRTVRNFVTQQLQEPGYELFKALSQVLRFQDPSQDLEPVRLTRRELSKLRAPKTQPQSQPQPKKEKKVKKFRHGRKLKKGRGRPRLINSQTGKKLIWKRIQRIRDNLLRANKIKPSQARGAANPYIDEAESLPRQVEALGPFGIATQIAKADVYAAINEQASMERAQGRQTDEVQFLANMVQRSTQAQRAPSLIPYLLEQIAAKNPVGPLVRFSDSMLLRAQRSARTTNGVNVPVGDNSIQTRTIQRQAKHKK